jgi:hypothetical protein
MKEHPSEPAEESSGYSKVKDHFQRIFLSGPARGHIKRPKPLLDPKEYAITTVRIKSTNKKKNIGQKGPRPGDEVIVIEDAPDHPQDEKKKVEDADRTTWLRRWHTRPENWGPDAGNWPDPKTGLQWDITSFCRLYGYPEGLHGLADNLLAFVGIAPDGKTTSSMDLAEVWPHDQESALQVSIAAAKGATEPRKTCYLMDGLPLVEDVVFFREPNYKGNNGFCYWKAISFHM